MMCDNQYVEQYNRQQVELQLREANEYIKELKILVLNQELEIARLHKEKEKNNE